MILSVFGMHCKKKKKHCYLSLGQVKWMPLAVSGRRVKRVRETAEVRQVRWETWGSQEWPQRETSIAAAAPRSLLISEIERDSAASLRARTVKHCMALCLANSANTCRLCVSSPGRDDPGERPGSS